MRVGRYELTAPVIGTFRLDGGAMFGSVPKNLWAKRIPADAENCIPLATRILVLQGEGRTVLVDVGLGEKWSDKERAIFAIENTPQALGVDPASVTDIVLTHLHFDHAGGISSWDAAGTVTASFPNAKLYLQKANLETAQRPSLKERASYRPENVDPVARGKLTLVDGDVEVLPDIWVHRIDGHTKGQQWIEIRGGASPVFYPTDLVPTAHHIPVAFHMGYDVCAERAMEEKAQFIGRALKERAVIVFEHDVDTAVSRVRRNAQGAIEPDQASKSLDTVVL